MKRWLRLGASLALLGATLYLLDWKAIGDALRRISVAGLAASFITTLMVFGVLGWRWHLIVQPLAPRPVLEQLRRYFLATYLNSFTPANLGGDIYRVVSLQPHSGTAAVLVAVLRERFLGLLSYLVTYVVLFLALLATSSKIPPLLTSAWIVAAFGAFALLLAPLATTRYLLKLRLIRTRPALEQGARVLDQAVRIDPRVRFVTLLGASVLGVGLWIGAVMIVAIDLGLSISWVALGAIVVLAELLRMLPITIQGLGLREATFAYLVALLGGAAESGFVLGAVSYAVLTLTLLACGVIGWLLQQVESRA